MAGQLIEQRRRSTKAKAGLADLIFRAVARSGGGLVLVIMVLVGTFLAYRAWGALREAGWSFLTTQDWNPDGGGFGIAAVIVGTILIAVVAIVVALPLAMGAALYHLRVRAATHPAHTDQPGRPDGRRAVGRLRPVGRVLPAVAGDLPVPVDQ
ncbi:MAG TPA: hypothetical protein VHV74_09345 [Pseudonocardiaceae bacterium]|nr:hypothetical protein [Pseudonocardiaceae bacterium]